MASLHVFLMLRQNGLHLEDKTFGLNMEHLRMDFCSPGTQPVGIATFRLGSVHCVFCEIYKKKLLNFKVISSSNSKCNFWFGNGT